ncbi:MAG: ATP-binding protein [Pseudomonadota bacterium]
MKKLLGAPTLALSTRLVLIMLTISMLASLVFAGAVFVQETSRLEQSSRSEISILSNVIASNLAAPILFDDREAALETIRSVAFKEDISQVIVFDSNAVVIAEIAQHKVVDSENHGLNFQSVGITEYVNHGNFLVGLTAIRLDGERLGTIAMALDLATQQNQRRSYLVLIAGILLAVLVLTYFLSRQLQKTVSGPILRLNQAMSKVTDSHDFSLRVDQNRQDDIGELYRGFNNMLHELEIRDRELTRHRDRLESGIANRTRELDELVRQRIDWLENMANFLRHELKNNIAGFNSSLQLIERKIETDDVEPVINRARRSLRYMGQLLDSVGGATSLQASLYGDRFDRIDLSSLIHQRVVDLSEVYGPQFHLNAESGIYIEGNEERISQLLDKLISNAVEHNSKDHSITIGLKASTQTATISVSNFGSALPENKDQIFDAFVSLRESGTGDHLGVGLFVVKLIAESHGGCVSADDLEHGEGARFSVSLPIPQA